MTSGASDRRRRRQRLVDGRTGFKVLAVAVTAAVSGGLTVAALNRASEPPASAYVRPAFTASAETPLVVPEASVVSVLSDSHAYNANSWFRQTVESGTVAGVKMGSFESQPGASAATLQARLDAAAAPGGRVLVQAGTNDLLSAVTPEETLTNIELLWDGLEQRGASPIAMLVPPSETRPALTVELNGLIRRAADERGLPLIDVYSDVAETSGAWRQGLSGDGVHANEEGSRIMAAAAAAQIAALISA